MADDKKIRVGIDASQAQAFEQKMRQSAQALSRDMIRDARAYTTSAKEINRVLDEQITAIEKRNRLEKEFSERKLKIGLERGEVTPEAYKKGVSSITSSYAEDKLQTQLLKEIVDAIKTTSRQEVREDRVNVEKRIQASRTVSQLNPDIDPEQAYKESIQQEYLQSLREDEGIQKGSYARYLGMPTDILGGNNSAQMLAQGLRGSGSLMRGFKGGLIGAAVAGVLAKGVEMLAEGVTRVEESGVDRSLLSGGMVSAKAGEMSPLVKQLRRQGISKYGLTPSEIIGTEYGIRRQAMVEDTGEYGKTEEEKMLRLSLLERGSFLDKGQISGLVGLRRYGATSTATGIEYYLQDLTRKTGQSLAAIPELANVLTQFSTNIASQTGRAPVAGTFRAMTALSQTGLEGVGLQTAMGAMQQGLMRSQNPVIQAMQFKAARSAAGANASLWDVEKIMADPFSNMDYVESLWGSLRKQTGGGQKFERALANIFPVNPLMAGDFANIDWKKVESTEDLKKKLQRSASKEVEAQARTGLLGESQASILGGKEYLGTRSLPTILEELNAVLKGFEKGKIYAENVYVSAQNKLATGEMSGEEYEALMRGRETEQRAGGSTRQQELDFQEQMFRNELTKPKGTMDSPLVVKIMP